VLADAQDRVGLEFALAGQLHDQAGQPAVRTLVPRIRQLVGVQGVFDQPLNVRHRRRPKIAVR
jgi:hypothetical protein